MQVGAQVKGLLKISEAKSAPITNVRAKMGLWLIFPF